MPADSQTLVIIGNDPSFSMDLSAFLGVSRSTGMRFSRLVDPTAKQLEDHIRSLRMEMQGDLPNIHIAAHMGEDGIQLQDGVVPPQKVSELLYGAPVVFLAGCKSARIGDMLSGIPFVLTMLEKVSNEDALDFSLIFWQAIGYNNDAREGYVEACRRLPIVAQFAYLFSPNRFLARKAT